MSHSAKWRPEDVLRTPEKRSDVLRTSPYGPMCNTKGPILSGTSLGRNQDGNLTIIHKMDFYGFFFSFPYSNCQIKLKIWYVLFWSYYGRLDLNSAIKWRPLDVVCRLGLYGNKTTLSSLLFLNTRFWSNFIPDSVCNF